MLRTSLRLAAALMTAVVAAALMHALLRNTPLYQYRFESFLRLSPGETRFYLIYGLVGAMAVAGLAILCFPVLRRVETLPPAVTSLRLLLAVSTLGAALAAVIGFGLLRNHVVTDDEYVYVFQSRLLLSGRASAPPPPLPLFFGNVFIGIQEGRWFGQYPPGHPLMLLLGVLLGMPRLIPILLVGVNMGLTGLLVRRLFGPGWGTPAALLLLTSPLFLLTGATLLSHETAYFALVVACYAALRTADSHRWVWSLLAGLGIGFLFMTRPWTGVTLGIFPAMLLARNAWDERRAGMIIPAAVALVLSALIFLGYNRDQTGHAFLTGYDAIRRGGGQIEFGFGPIIPGIYTHTLVRGLRNLVLLFIRFQFWAWAWPIALMPFLFALRRHRDDTPLHRRLVRGTWWMFAVGFAAYIPYWSIGVNDTGPVKMYELLLPFTVLTIEGIRRWANARGPREPAAWGVAAFIVALAMFWPVTVAHLDRLSASVAAPLDAIERGVERPAVVFVHDPGLATGQSWVFGRPNPRPDLSDPILIVRDLGPADRDLLRLLPGRRGYALELMPGDYRVVAIGQ
jgi:hypothetical protein